MASRLSRTVVLRALAIWSLFVPLAIANGAARDWLLAPRLGAGLALPLSGLTLSALILLLTWLLIPRLGELERRQYARVGALWLGATLGFELLFGRYVVGVSWGSLLAALDPRSGNLWLLVLMVTASAPYISARMRRLI